MHLLSVKFTPHFILEEGPHVACPPFFLSPSTFGTFVSFSSFHFHIHIFHFFLFFLSPISRIPYISVDFIFNVSLPSFRFHISIFHFFCFLSPTSHIPLAVLATHFHSILSFSPVQILHSIHFTLFIQFNSLSSFFFIRSPSFVIAPPSCW